MYVYIFIFCKSSLNRKFRKCAHHINWLFIVLAKAASLQRPHLNTAHHALPHPLNRNIYVCMHLMLYTYLYILTLHVHM